MHNYLFTIKEAYTSYGSNNCFVDINIEEIIFLKVMKYVTVSGMTVCSQPPAVHLHYKT